MDNGIESIASYDTLPNSHEGETAVTSGCLGVGKLIPPCVSVGSAKFISGMAKHCGEIPIGLNFGTVSAP